MRLSSADTSLQQENIACFQVSANRPGKPGRVLSRAQQEGTSETAHGRKMARAADHCKQIQPALSNPAVSAACDGFASSEVYSVTRFVAPS